MNKKIKLKIIAKNLNTSVSTVSRVLNDKPGISDKMRYAVLKEVKKQQNNCSYGLSILAKSSKQTVGLISRQRSRDIDSFYYHQSIFSYEKIFKNKNYQGIPFYLNDEELKDSTTLELIKQSGCSGFILRGQSLPKDFIFGVKSLGKPIILVENNIEDRSIDTVICNDKEASYQITKQLILKGYKSIVHLTGPKQWYNNKNRLLGYLKAINESNLKEQILIRKDTTIQMGQDSLELVYSKFPDCRAIFAVNDAMAIGLLNQARFQKIQIPDQLAIFGFDDIPWASMSYPALSTAHIDIEQMEELAAHRIIQLIENSNENLKIPAAKVEIAVNIIERDSH